MKKRSMQFRLMVSRGVARLEAAPSQELASLSFSEGSALFRSIAKTAVRTLRRHGFVPRRSTGLSRIDPLGFLSGKMRLPLDPVAAPVAMRRRRIVLEPICIECVCKGDGGCECKIVACPGKPIA